MFVGDWLAGNFYYKYATEIPRLCELSVLGNLLVTKNARAKAAVREKSAAWDGKIALYARGSVRMTS